MQPNFFNQLRRPLQLLLVIAALAFTACEKEDDLAISQVENSPTELATPLQHIAATADAPFDPVPEIPQDVEGRNLSITEFLGFKPQFSILLEAINSVPALAETLSNPDLQITIFAPTNDAFAAFLENTEFTSLDDIPTETLSAVLMNHVLTREGRIAVIEFQESEPTLADGQNPLMIEITGQETAIINGNINIVQGNQFINRTILHAIDQVIPLSSPEATNFTVTIENVVMPKPIYQSGTFAVPVGADGPAPLFPGDAYEITFQAGPNVLPGDGGIRFSFVYMFVQSNDLFFAPSEEGIRLFDEEGNAIGSDAPADVTDQVLLWDAGTEVNTLTGSADQKPQQAPDAEDVGMDENGVVTEIMNNTDGLNTFPAVNEVINVTITNNGGTEFTVRIENVSDGMTIATPALGEDATAAVPVSPGVYAVHTSPAPFFTTGEPATEGIEDIAEDGFLDVAADMVAENTGLIIPLSPGVWAVHEAGVRPLFITGAPDFGEGLEGIAEDGTPMQAASSLAAKAGVSSSALFNTPVGANSPGPLVPGGQYQFTFEAKPGDRLSLTTMFVQSNDWIYTFADEGLPLFDGMMPVSGDVTEFIRLYDAGTEIDEFPGAGLHQVIRQANLDGGPADPNPSVRRVTDAPEIVPANEQVIRVTITAQ